MNKLTRQQLGGAKWFLPLLGCLIGAIVFLVVYGVQPLVPTNVDWLLTGGDLSQHYLGWEFFRQSAWTFPLGVAKNLAYPHGLAITFMDSLPLFAIPTKLFASWLPQHFQYFGLWGLLSFMLMGGISAAIVKRWTRDLLVIMATALFFCLSPIVFQRMFNHTALAGQWVIMFGIYAVVSARQWTVRMQSIAWSVILVLSVLIHPYFLPMNLFLLAVASVIRYKWPKQTALEVGIPILAALVATWLIGGFTFSTVSGGVLTEPGYDLASFFLPMPDGWSAVPWSNASVLGESFAYAGLGGLLLVSVAVVVAAKNRVRMQELFATHQVKTWIVVALIALLFIVAVGPTIRLAGTELVHYHVPHAIEKLWAIFRVTARLAWVLYYALFVAAAYVLLRFVKRRSITRWLFIALCLLQLFDILRSPQIIFRQAYFRTIQTAHFSDTLSDPRWQKIINGRKHIVYLGDLRGPEFVNLAQFAIDHNLTLNTGYFAREPSKQIEATIAEAKNDLQKNTPDKDTVYLANESYSVASGLIQQTIDGYVVTVQ